MEVQVCSRPTASTPRATELMWSSSRSWQHRSDEMHAELFTDGVDEITVGGSIVRVDFCSLSPTERDANNAPKRVFCQRLIFSVESFANSVDVMQNALQGLVDAGVVRRNQPAESHNSTSVVRDALAPSTPRSHNASSNFR